MAAINLALAPAFTCPKELVYLCESLCITKNCLPSLSRCLKDATCRGSLASFTSCYAGNNGSDAMWPYDCMVPNNEMRNDFFFCATDAHPCIPPTPSPVTYPKCDDTIAGDPAFELSRIAGEWYKVAGWKLGEQVECMDCQHIRMTEGGHGSKVEMAFHSNWTSPDKNGKVWPMTALANLVDDSARGAGKLFNSGRMQLRPS